MTEQKGPPVSWQKRGGVLVVTIDNPPVNAALAASVRRGLLEALSAASVDAYVKVVLLVSKGRNFIAGADISEFGKPPQSPSLPDVCAVIESCDKPVVAVIQGAALGGGLEVALAAHYRLASSDARFGFPEVTLGLIPGAGGTQRAPRVIGIAPALGMMLSGKPINAQEAQEVGLLDRLVEGEELTSAGLAYANELLVSGAVVRRSKDGNVHKDTSAAGQEALLNAGVQLNGKYRGQFAPAKIVEAVAATLEAPFVEGVAIERRNFLSCMDAPQRKALIHAFFSQREAAKIPGLEGVSSRELQQVGVVGGGTMGAGISCALLDAGFNVVLLERDEESLEAGCARIKKVYDRKLSKGRMRQDEADALLKRLGGSTQYASLSTADLVIEAVFEDLVVKGSVFKELDRVCKPGTILASNTSYLDINKLASQVSRPEDVVGLHFFSPANVMKLLEIVVPDRVADEVLVTVLRLAHRMGKVAVRAGVCDGFIGNRILATYRQAADYMLADGASPYAIDAAVKDFGFPMGPFEVSDLAGGDIGWATRKRRAASRDPRVRYVEVADRLCERGWFGQKTGRGWYRYGEEARHGEQDPSVLAIVDEERQRLAVTARAFDAKEIMCRYLAAMVNEGAKVVEEGIALRPLDVDVVLLNGYGFPRHLGGPMYYADQVGLDRILADIHRFSEEDPLFWQPAGLLVELVEKAGSFEELNQGLRTGTGELKNA